MGFGCPGDHRGRGEFGPHGGRGGFLGDRSESIHDKPGKRAKEPTTSSETKRLKKAPIGDSKPAATKLKGQRMKQEPERGGSKTATMMEGKGKASMEISKDDIQGWPVRTGESYFDLAESPSWSSTCAEGAQDLECSRRDRQRVPGPEDKEHQVGAYSLT